MKPLHWEKVQSLKHIKAIPVGMFGFHRGGLMSHGIEKQKDTGQFSRTKKVRMVQKRSRQLNRAK